MSHPMSFERHGGNIYKAARQTKYNMQSFLDFSANINPLGLSQQVLISLSESLAAIVHYPDVEAYDFKKSVSEFYRMPDNMITPGNGAVELMYILCYIIRPKSVLVTAPTFSEYERAARASGAKVKRIFLKPERDFLLNIDEIIAALPSVDMLFIGNPNNPTGTLTANRDVERILKAANQNNVWVVVDEAFMDFLVDDSFYTCRSFLESYSNLIIIHSLTKFYAVPGLRLGFALSNSNLAEKLQLSKDQWNVNSLAQLAGVAALHDTAYQQKSRVSMQNLKNQMYNALAAVAGLKPYYPAANYILINIKGTGLTSDQMEQELFKKNILIRNCANYPGLSTDYIRTAVKLPEQNKILLDEITQIAGDRK